MPLDPQARALLDQTAALNLPPTHTVSPEQARINSELTRSKIPGPEVARVEDRTIPGPGGALPIRVYTPAGSAPFPALAFYHGGGWVVGSIEQSDAVCRRLAVGAGCVVVSVDYRLAPEAKFPAAAEDCYVATKWIADNAAAIGVDAGRIAVGGISAGGNLAAAVPLMARDRGGPRITHQLLVVPVTDYGADYPSYTENAEGFQLTKASMDWYWRHYLRDAADGRNPYAVPMRADRLDGLPPALVQTAEFDPLRDEGEAYAARLKAAGVPVTLTRYAGMIHGFFSAAGVLDKGQEATAEAAAALRTAFAATPV